MSIPLPPEPAPAGTPTSQVASMNADGKGLGKKPCLLLIDDNELQLLIHASSAEKMGYTCIPVLAANGQDYTTDHQLASKQLPLGFHTEQELHAVLSSLQVTPDFVVSDLEIGTQLEKGNKVIDIVRMHPMTSRALDAIHTANDHAVAEYRGSPYKVFTKHAHGLVDVAAYLNEARRAQTQGQSPG